MGAFGAPIHQSGAEKSVSENRDPVTPRNKLLRVKENVCVLVLTQKKGSITSEEETVLLRLLF